MFKKIKDYFHDITRPLTEAEKALKGWGVEYERKPDGTLFVPGNLSVPRKGLTRLPDLSSVEVGGSFLCDNNKLSSLEGSPKSVGRHFWCNGNQLASLKGASQSVGGSFICLKNPLTSLEHAPVNFKTLYSDFGDFSSWATVPDALKVSTETREREKQAQLQKKLQELESRERDIRDATVLKDALKPAPRIRLKK